MAFKLDKYYETEQNNQVQRATDLANKQKADVNQAYDTQIQKMTDSAEKQTIAAENSYDAAYADNAVQKFVNERQIQTSMANAGMQDSGLNRTQLTAVQLQKANADNNVTHNKNLFINKIRTALQESIATAEQSRTTELNSIDTQLTSNINNINNTFDSQKISKMEEIIATIASITDPTQAAGYIKTVSKQYGVDGSVLASYSPVVTKKGYQKYLKDENYYNKKTGFKELQTTLAGIDTTSAAGLTVAAKQIKSWAQQNNATKSQIKKALSAAGISYSEYNSFLKDGQYFNKKYTVSTGSSSRGSSGGSDDYEKQWYADVEDATDSILTSYERNKDVWPADQRHKGLAPLIKALMGKYEQSQVELAIANAGFDVNACITAAGYTPIAS